MLKEATLALADRCLRFDAQISHFSIEIEFAQ